MTIAAQSLSGCHPALPCGKFDLFLIALRHYIFPLMR
jgi:hypothetical protein